jgi:hypothetical protein
LGCGQLSVGREVTNRVTIKWLCYQSFHRQGVYTSANIRDVSSRCGDICGIQDTEPELAPAIVFFVVQKQSKFGIQVPRHSSCRPPLKHTRATLGCEHDGNALVAVFGGLPLGRRRGAVARSERLGIVSPRDVRGAEMRLGGDGLSSSQQSQAREHGRHACQRRRRKCVPR